MTREVVESDWANIGFFSPPSRPGRMVRRLERLHVKILKERQFVVINRTCRDNNLLPIYIYIYIYINKITTIKISKVLFMMGIKT